MNNEISKYDDTIEYSDLMEQIEDLQSERADYVKDGDVKSVIDLNNTLTPLQDFADDLEDAGDAKDCSLINLAYLPKYLQEQFAENGGYDDNTFEVQYIDWDRVAKDAKCDYSMVEFDDCTFLYR